MKYVKNYECTLCNKTYTEFSLLTCPACGEKGILEINYDYDKMKLEVTKEYFEKNRHHSMTRYSAMMSIKHIVFDGLKVGWTPLYHSHNLAKQLGMDNLYFKDDSLNPTASLKDRASLVACMKALEEGKRCYFL